jgi:ubiquinone/menaquinone biosynthesis C-methylase UbiE
MNNKDTKKQIAGVFTRAAPTYGEVGFKFFDYFGKKLVEITKIPKKAKVLDVASGRGASLFPSSKKVGVNGSVIGIDISEGMVQKTTEEIIKSGISNIKMMQMDAENLKFQDNTFDAAFYGFCIFFFPQYNVALNECLRVLKPNGKIGVSTFLKGTFEETKWIDDLFDKYILNQDSDSNEEETNDFEFNTIDGMKKILINAGFKEVQTKLDEKEFICESADEIWEGLWSVYYRNYLERINSEDLQKLKEEIVRDFPKNTAKDGLHWTIKVIFTFGRK